VCSSEIVNRPHNHQPLSPPSHPLGPSSLSYLHLFSPSSATAASFSRSSAPALSCRSARARTSDRELVIMRPSQRFSVELWEPPACVASFSAPPAPSCWMGMAICACVVGCIGRGGEICCYCCC
jgi:hypothetical protein